MDPVDPSGPPDGSKWRLLLGPPGTGKTEALLRHFERELHYGIAPTEIAFVTFTRSARLEAKSRIAKRFAIDPDDLSWVRTLHSCAFRLLGLRGGDLLTEKEWSSFTAEFGYDFSASHVLSEDDDNLDFNVKVATKDDALMAAFDWARNRNLGIRDAIRLAPFRIKPREFLTFVNRYLAMKAEAKKRDFHDLLAMSLVSDKRPPVRVAFIDEAQDLSPLQVKIVEKWFAPCERVYVAGDDDQAIFSFMGGDPSWLLELARTCTVEMLEKSHRVPALLHDMAQKAIAPNRHRVDKIYRPKDEAGEIRFVARRRAVDLIVEDEDTFVLARNWTMLRDIAKLLRESGIAYVVERFANWSPLGTGHGPVLRAWKGALILQQGKRIKARDLDAVLAYIQTTSKTLLPPGTKKKAKENKGWVDLDVLRVWGLLELATRIENDGVEILTKIRPRLRNELRAITVRYGKIPEPKVVLTSMHSSKGREADTVIIVPDMTRAAFRAYTRGRQDEAEAENRLAYVAITRTRRRLLICHPESRRYYPYQALAARARIPLPSEDDWSFGD